MQVFEAIHLLTPFNYLKANSLTANFQFALKENGFGFEFVHQKKVLLESSSKQFTSRAEAFSVIKSLSHSAKYHENYKIIRSKPHFYFIVVQTESDLPLAVSSLFVSENAAKNCIFQLQELFEQEKVKTIPSFIQLVDDF